LSLLTCSAEDLVIMKAFANRPRDWADIKSVIERSPVELDKTYILARLAPLAEIKSAPEIIATLKALF